MSGAFSAPPSLWYLGNSRFAEPWSGDWFDLRLYARLGSCRIQDATLVAFRSEADMTCDSHANFVVALSVLQRDCLHAPPPGLPVAKLVEIRPSFHALRQWLARQAPPIPLMRPLTTEG